MLRQISSSLICIVFFICFPMCKGIQKETVFFEDFNNSLIDESIWTIATWLEHGGQCGWDRCYIEDGNLIMELINEDSTILSSAIETKQTFLYGKWEARLKPSSLPGVLNSFYTIDWDNQSTPDPGDGTKQEIDIEFLTYTFEDDKGKVHFAVHAHGLRSFNTNPDIELDFDPSKDFHVWGFDITPEQIEWFVDEKTLLVYKYRENDVKINSPYRLKLNHWTQSDWILGPPEPGMKSKYLIDWIKFTPHK
jgi:Beta-glucanase/Beta-glucan synthetase